jgi:hypothetical protein
MAVPKGNLHTGQGYIGDGAITAYTETTLRFPGAIGQVTTVDGITYQLVKMHSGADSVIVNEALVWQDLDDFTVTNDISDGVDGVGINFPAGVALGTVSASDHCYIQVDGPGTVLTNGDDNIAAGDSLIVNADGVVDSIAGGTASTYTPLGIATAADSDSANTVALRVTAPHNGW